MDAIIARYGELWLKSSWVKRQMQRMLIANISICLKRNGIKFEKIKAEDAGIVIFTHDKKTLDSLKNVFGISNYSPVYIVEKDFDKIKEKALEIYRNAGKGATFRITARRSDKKFPVSSQILAAKVGEHIIGKTNAKAKMKEFDCEIHIDVSDRAYLYSEKFPGAGGIPIGSQQRVLCIIRNQKDIEACKKMMRRGCLVSLMCFGKCPAKNLEKEYYNCNEKLQVIKSKEKDVYAAAIAAAKKINAKAVVAADDIKKMAEERSRHNFLLLNPIL